MLADVAPGFPPEGKQAFRVMSEKVAAGGLGSIADIASNRVFHADYLAKHPGAIAERRAVLLKIDPGAFRAACAALIDADLVAQLPQMKVPTLVVFGELDQATPPALNVLISSKVPGARHVELKGCGHCPPLEQPQQFLAAIDDFIAGPERPPPLFAFLQQIELARQPARGRRLDQNGHQNGDEGDRGDHLGAGRLHAEQQPGKRRRDHAGLAGPAHEQHLVEAPARALIGQCAQEHRQRAGNEHKDGHDDDAAARDTGSSA